MNAGLRARDLVAQLLTFSREKEEKLQLVMPGPIIKEVQNFLRASISAMIEMEYVLETKDVQILIDPTQLHQLIMNLCVNACHAMGGEGGLLKVSLDTKTISTMDASILDLEEAEYVVISVCDTGMGISHENLERIFDPFFTTKEQGEGTGIGLSVVHGIVKKSGGAIEVKTKIGQGTTFNVYLQKAEKEEKKVELENTETDHFGKGCVLVVDDETALLEIGQQQLNLLGYEVVSTTDPNVAWDYFHQGTKPF